MSSQKVRCIITNKTAYSSKDGVYICKEAKDLYKKGYNLEKIREMIGEGGEYDEISLEQLDTLIPNTKTKLKMINQAKTSVISQLVTVKSDDDVVEYINNIVSGKK